MLEASYNIADLARLGGVSRRTVRYYVQRGLIPEPTGTGRGNHYNQSHLDALIQVRRWQEEGVSLAEIQRRLRPPDANAQVAAAPEPPWQGQSWLRVTVARGVELHLSQDALSQNPDLEHITQVLRRALLQSPNKEKKP
jgi:DNA-binding transcriptional MerR regulator